MRFDRPTTAKSVRWGRALAWIAAWALVVAAGYFAPLGIAIALAIGVFGPGEFSLDSYLERRKIPETPSWFPAPPAETDDEARAHS